MDRCIERARALFEAQHGVAHVAQLRRLGVGGGQVQARMDSGSWRRAAPQVVAVAGAPTTDLHRVWCAALAVGTCADGTERPAAVGGMAAAALLGVVPDHPEAVEMVVARGVWWPRVAGVHVRVVSDWRQRRFVRRDGLLVTALPDTLVDVAAHLPDGPFLTLLQDQCFGRPRLLGRVVSRCHRGSKGSARARRVGAQLAVGLDSHLHARAAGALRRAGLVPDACDAEVVPGAGPSDCVYVGARGPVLALEFDGDMHRLSRRAFLHDRRKDLMLREAGVVTLRFTVEQVDQPKRLVADVRRALATSNLQWPYAGEGYGGTAS